MLTYSKLGIDRKCLHLASASTSCRFLGYTYLDAAVSNIDLSLLNEQSEQKHQNAAFYLLCSEGIFEHQNMGIFRHKIPILLLK